MSKIELLKNISVEIFRGELGINNYKANCEVIGNESAMDVAR